MPDYSRTLAPLIEKQNEIMKNNEARQIGMKIQQDHKVVSDVVEVMNKLKNISATTDHHDEKKYMYMHAAPWHSDAVREPDFSG